MIKRMNKITSLLVAAAAIVSLVPATGANAAERLGTKDGTIENAIAFKDGKYIYQGYKSDDDDQAIYYNNGDKDKQLDDMEDADIKGIYGEKYAFLDDNGDQYLVDLSTGKVSDDETPEDKQENVESKLRSTLKKTDRYDQGTTVSAATIKGTGFGDTWYSYQATPGTNADTSDQLVDGKLFGFTNESGKYIDASNIANIHTYSYAKKKVVKVKEFNDRDNDAELTVTLAKQPEVLTQDKDYIYALVDVNVTTAAGSTPIKETHLQKISKTQGEKKDGAYLPKSVESYRLDDKSLYDNGDVKDAHDLIMTPDSDTVKNEYRVVNGVLYVTRIKEGNVQVNKLKLTKIKENAATGISVSGKLDGYVVKKDDDSDQDINLGINSVSIDVDGNTWCIYQGKIYKFNGLDKKVMFTCDRSLDTLNVYNEKSLIAWENGEDVYTTVQEGSAETDSETTPAQTGWVNTAAGWTFYDAAGKQVVGSWVNAGGVWYMIKADGIMATGWYNDNGTWYYLNASGAMQTGWFNDNGTWYYLQSSGAMKTGWLNDNGTWYYLNASGAMLANTTVDGYVLNASGAWVK